MTVEAVEVLAEAIKGSAFIIGVAWIVVTWMKLAMGGDK